VACDGDAHTVILCSDGLTDVVASDRAAEATAGLRSPGFGGRKNGRGGGGQSLEASRFGYGSRGNGTAPEREKVSPESPSDGRRRRSSSASAGTALGTSSVGILGTPGGVVVAREPPVNGGTPDHDGWWGNRRVATALTSLAKMRQSADNVCVLVCRARRLDPGSRPESGEDGARTRKTTPAVTPVKAESTPVRVRAQSKTPVKTPVSKRKTPNRKRPETEATPSAKAPTPLKSPSQPRARPPQSSTPGSARDAKRARGDEYSNLDQPGQRTRVMGTPVTAVRVAPASATAAAS
jgi:hypothetical protein